MFNNRAEFSELIGKVIEEVIVEGNGHHIRFLCDDGSEYKMYHEQECCESVRIESIVGQGNIVDSPVLQAEERSGNGPDSEWGSSTWTFYTIATVKGYCDIRWLGESNGYYSESVDFVRVK